MFIYFYFYIVIFLFAIFNKKKIIFLKNDRVFFYKILFISILSIYIGLRDEVGGDWGTYYESYYVDKLNLSYKDYLFNYLLVKDPLFHLINFLGAKIFESYYVVNFILAFLFSYCLVQFSFSLSKPFLALLISSPVLITVVAMGYHRQALSVAFFMLGLLYLNKNSFIKYSLFIFIGTMFHFSGFFLFIFEIFINKKINLLKVIFVVLIIFISVFVFIGTEIIFISLGRYLNSYNSSGATLRLFMSLIPSLIFLFFYKKFKFDFNENLLKSLSYFTIFLFFLMLVLNSSAIIDRFGIYLIPLQMIIWSNFINLFENKKNSNNFIFYFISLAYFVVLILWIHFGDYSMWWLPYNNIIYNYL